LSLHRKKTSLRNENAFFFARLLHSVRNDKEKVSFRAKRSKLASCHSEEEEDSIALPGAGVAISHYVIARNEETWQSHIE